MAQVKGTDANGGASVNSKANVEAAKKFVENKSTPSPVNTSAVNANAQRVLSSYENLMKKKGLTQGQSISGSTPLQGVVNSITYVPTNGVEAALKTYAEQLQGTKNNTTQPATTGLNTTAKKSGIAAVAPKSDTKYTPTSTAGLVGVNGPNSDMTSPTGVTTLAKADGINIANAVPYLTGDNKGLEKIATVPLGSGVGKPNSGVKTSAVDDTPSDQTPGTTPGQNGGGGGGSGGGGGGGYGSSASSLLSQLNGLGGLGGGTATPYSYISQPAGTNSEAAAAIYAQLLQNSGYDLSQPLSNIALPNRVDLPEEVALPENFNFAEAYNNIPEVQIGRVDRVDTHPEEEMLGQIADLQSQQAILSADNTVNNGITELQRVMQNAQDQYLAQQNQIAMDEARAKDNQVLYNEARGDRGGIGQAQYDTIQNTAATNRLTVQKEQTQLATDTARQIADLRSQGEFEKANQLLSISQKYLSELMDLYQWAKETNVSIDEFNLQVAQWEENFKLSLVGAELDAEAFNLNVANAMIDQQNNRFNAAFNQENALFDARLNAAKLQNDEALARLNAQLNVANATGAFGNGAPTYAAQQDAIANQLKERSMLADIGTALIKAGIQPSNQILEAMGMGGTATGVEGSALAGTAFAGMDAESVLRSMGIGNAGLAGISQLGYTPETFLAEALGEGNTAGTVAGLPALDTASLSGGAYTAPTGGEQMLSQLSAYPNYQSEIAAYAEPTQAATSTIVPTINDYYQASQIMNGNNMTSQATNASALSGISNADATNLLRAAGIGNAGLAGLASLGISPELLVSQAFGY